MNERLAQHALARHFDYFKQTVVPNVYFGGGEMDLAVVTRAGYLVEVEIELSLADWNADKAKDKWSAAYAKYREPISRFYYAVPTILLERGVPAWVPNTAGLLELQFTTKANHPSCYVRERRPAVKAKTRPLDDKQMRVLLASTYHRFWQRELRAAA